MNNLALAPSVEYMLTILSGPDKGTQYKLISSKVTLGRGDENDITIKNDNKCSRNHAAITVTPEGIQIEDVSQKNKIIVDGKETKKNYLSDKSIFILGDTSIRFSIKEIKNELALHERQKENHLHAVDSEKKSNSRSSKGKARPKSNFIRIAYILVGLFVLYILTSEQSKKNSTELRTQSQVNDEISRLKEETQKIKSSRFKSKREQETFEIAQSNYIKGFRDFRNGQFERAIESFQACLSIYPGHGLCKRYLKMSTKKYNELIQYYMIEGRKHRSQNQFQTCKTSFRNVMVMVKDQNSQIYKEAKANYNACLAQLDGVY